MSMAPSMRGRPSMTDEMPGPDLENRVVLFLEITEPDWACRPCIARTLDVTLQEVKIALLRLARFRGRDYIETGCDLCDGCGASTAVLRRAPPRRLRRIA
jgi:hypothetical protein